MNDKELTGLTQRLRLPLQAAPVNRTVVASALTNGGVEASGFDWGSLASTALPILASLF